ncbi:MAG: shikimate dehydrogenase [Brevundimonas subvibrioides]|uniref:Shikimate dehydrogenase n=1 Tax=Brevundimonas subvibrioides TaxID=74313 RepID=A0A258HLL1_9CAUL|nr:shikimate dehydrogenase [Brevundimonas subvibrioides]OYX57860.1 MAG: shikimate dehydrogenase [Brevundimonas subvibrioides]
MTDKPAAPSSSTISVGLIGSGIGKSLTPAMHMAEGARQGLRYDYALMDTAALGESPGLLARLVDQAEAEGYRGLNITHPFKQEILNLLTETSADVEALGACNTVVFENGSRTGHNTDWSGFTRSFKRGLPDAAMGKVVQVGAGGAGAATAYALLLMGAGQIEVFDVDRERAERLAARLNALGRGGRVKAGNVLESALRRCDGVVQATAVGMESYPGTPFDPELLSPANWLAEVIYFPAQTALLQAAAKIGCRTLTGAGMAVFQAVTAFELFAGRAADPNAMLRHFDSLVTIS